MIDRNDEKFLTETLTFWPHLNPVERLQLIENTFSASFKRGDAIHRGDEDCAGILIIKSGGLRTYMLSEDGREITLYRLSPGDVCVLSSSCVLSNITFDVHIDADLDSDILMINSEVYAALSAQNIYVENFSYKEAVSRFSDVMWAMQQILFMSFDKRLANFLIDEIARTGLYDIPMTHDQIAKYIGSAREVVSRMLKYFASEGYVALSRGGVKVIDKIRLRALIR